MKTKDKNEKVFDTVKIFREIKKKIALETDKMTFQQFKKYLSDHKFLPTK